MLFFVPKGFGFMKDGLCLLWLVGPQNKVQSRDGGKRATAGAEMKNAGRRCFDSADPLGLPLTDTSGVLQRPVREINQRHAESVRSPGVDSRGALLMPEFRGKLH